MSYHDKTKIPGISGGPRAARRALDARWRKLWCAAHDLLEVHLTAMKTLHPDHATAIEKCQWLLLCDDIAVWPTLEVLGLAVPEMREHASALSELATVIGYMAETSRLKASEIDQYEVDLTAREEVFAVAKRRLAAAFPSPEQEVVLSLIEEKRRLWPYD